MKYLKVFWIHSFDDEPILLYSEIDNNRYELRKIEIYKNDSFGLAKQGYLFGGTLLGTEPIPDVSEILKDSQFIPRYITKEEFENVWNDYVAILRSVGL